MKFLKRLKSSNFWVSMLSAVILILQAVFNVEIKTEYLTQIIMAILGLLVMSGIITDTPSDEVTVKQNIDIDSIKDSVTNIFTQMTTAIETNLTSVVKQFEDMKINTSNIQHEEVKTENIVEINPAVETIENKQTEDVNIINQNTIKDENVTISVVDEQNTL